MTEESIDYVCHSGNKCIRGPNCFINMNWHSLRKRGSYWWQVYFICGSSRRTKKVKILKFLKHVIDESSYDPFLNQNPTKPFRKTEDLDNNCGDKGRNHKANKRL